MSEKTICHENVVVAAIDILGFKNIVLNDQSGTRSLDILEYILRQSSVNLAFSEDNSKSYPLFWASEEFADSIYLVGIPGKSLKEQLFSVSGAVMTFISVGICGRTKFAIRAGITSGVIWEREVSLFNGKKKKIIMGPGLIHAHQMEISQSWLGGAVSIETEAPIDESYLIEYDVPVKAGCIKKPKYALNWPKILMQNSSVETNTTIFPGHEVKTYPVLPDDPKAEITSVFRSTGPMAEPEEEKLTNTLLFWDTMVAKFTPSIIP